MFKKLAKGAGTVLSMVSLGSMATAGSLAEGIGEPEVEALVVEEEASRSIGILPILGLVVIGAIIATSGGNGNNNAEPDPDPKIPPDL